MLTDAEREMALDYLRKDYSAQKVARFLGKNHAEVRDLQVQEVGTFVRSNDGWGRPELREFIIATKHVDHEWPHNDPIIEAAKQRYDNGDSELATGRDGSYLLLYEFPRKEKATNRVPYFSRLFGED